VDLVDSLVTLVRKGPLRLRTGVCARERELRFGANDATGSRHNLVDSLVTMVRKGRSRRTGRRSYTGGSHSSELEAGETQ
jgi:hypothetical protein